MRDILQLFTEDRKALEDLVRRLSAVPKEHWDTIYREYGPRIKPLNAGELAHSDNYVRDEARLGSDETKRYIHVFLGEGVLVRNDEQSLEITEKGVNWLHDLNNLLQLDCVKASKAMLRSAQRGGGLRTEAKEAPDLASAVSCACL